MKKKSKKSIDISSIYRVSSMVDMILGFESRLNENSSKCHENHIRKMLINRHIIVFSNHKINHQKVHDIL